VSPSGGEPEPLRRKILRKFSGSARDDDMPTISGQQSSSTQIKPQAVSAAAHGRSQLTSPGSAVKSTFNIKENRSV
jgi:hypothetical protein